MFPDAAKVRCGVLAGIALMFLTAAFAIGADDGPEKRVIILANAKSDASLELARYYAGKRGVPEDNIVALSMPLVETISWRQFVDEVYQPLQDELVRRGWIVATGSTLKDEAGRTRYAIAEHRISYLVTCLGVPLRIAHDASLYEEVPPLTKESAFRTNHGAVDAELALVVRSGYPINAYVPNPLFQKRRPTVLDLNKVVKVSRLDGPALADAKAVIDHALEAEARGLIGKAYVDLGGPHAEGDRWFEAVVKQLELLEFDLTVDRASETLAVDAGFEAPALYFGWYANHVNGPFMRPGFQFPPGAVALHLHSFSADTLRSANKHWCGPLVGRGVTATVGNVYEPYLTFTHHPHLLLEALVRGETWGDASSYALRAVSWQQIAIGDPLYRPFKVSFADQWVGREALPDALYPFVILREAGRLERAGQLERALALVGEANEGRPGAVLKQWLDEREGASRIPAEGLETAR